MPSERRRVWPAHPALTRPLTTMGVERSLFMLAVVVSYAIYRLVSAIGGAVVFAGLYVAAYAANRRDPQLVKIVRVNVEARRRYDPGLPPSATRRVE